MKPLDVKPTKIPRGELKTEVHARAYVQEIIDEMQLWRHLCDVVIPDKGQTPAQAQRAALYIMLTKQGQVQGALKVLKLCGLISDSGYVELTKIATNALLPTNMGTVQ